MNQILPSSSTACTRTPWGLVLVLLVVALPGCSIWETDNWNGGLGERPESTFGMRPVYARADAFEVYSDVTRQIVNGIAVFEEGSRLFTVDADLGIHIVDNSNPSSPRQIAFIQVPGVRTASASGNFLYANNFTDFVTIDISDLNNAQVIDRQADFYESPPASPPNYSGFFECYNPDQGPLLGWEEGLVENPECRSAF